MPDTRANNVRIMSRISLLRGPPAPCVAVYHESCPFHGTGYLLAPLYPGSRDSMGLLYETTPRQWYGFVRDQTACTGPEFSGDIWVNLTRHLGDIFLVPFLSLSLSLGFFGFLFVGVICAINLRIRARDERKILFLENLTFRLRI